jgi:hypothetical protein
MEEKPSLVSPCALTEIEPKSVEVRLKSISVSVPSDGSNLLNVTVVLCGSLLLVVPGSFTSAGDDVTVKVHGEVVQVGFASAVPAAGSSTPMLVSKPIWLKSFLLNLASIPPPSTTRFIRENVANPTRCLGKHEPYHVINVVLIQWLDDWRVERRLATVKNIDTASAGRIWLPIGAPAPASAT